jgi:hypothetical protein
MVWCDIAITSRGRGSGSTCIVCLCRYHKLAVTQGASLINLEGLTPTKRQHGWHRAEGFWKFCVSKSSEMAFPKSFIPLLFGTFINSFIMVCESMLFASQDGLLREMFFIKISFTDIWLYIYTNIRFQILLVSKSIGFFLVGGQNYSPPPYKTLGWGPVAHCVTNLFSRALQQLKSMWSGKCNPVENV